MTEIKTPVHNDNQRVDSRPYLTSMAGLDGHFSEGNGSFEGYVPSSIVERDRHLPFKIERTEELVEDLLQTRIRDGWGNGQDSPMLAAFITGESAPALEVYDGLHRQVANEIFQRKYGIEDGRPFEVRRAIGNAAVHFVTVKPMTRRDMLDKRLTNTRNHPELRFARGGMWSAQLWYLDDISKLAPHISPKQAFNLAERDHADASKVGSRIGLSPYAVRRITDWARERAEAWSVDPSTVYKWIHRAEATTPEIVAMVRNPGKGRRVEGIITESMLESLTAFMGGEEFRDVHTVIVRFAVKNRLNNVQFSNLVSEIMNTESIRDPSDIQQIIPFLDRLNVTTLNQRDKARTQRRLRRRTDIFTAGAGAVASVGDAIDRVAESLAVRSERTLFVPDADQRKAAMEAAERLEQQAEQALHLAEMARRSARAPREPAPAPTFSSVERDPHAPQPALSDRETQILQLAAQGLTAYEIGQSMYLSPKTAKNYLSSVYAKLGVRNKMEAVIRGAALGLLSLDNHPDASNTNYEVAMLDDLERAIEEISAKPDSMPPDERLRSTVSKFHALLDKVETLRPLVAALELRLSSHDTSATATE